jgi:hypothetical protein
MLSANFLPRFRLASAIKIRGKSTRAFLSRLEKAALKIISNFFAFTIDIYLGLLSPIMR